MKRLAVIIAAVTIGCPMMPYWTPARHHTNHRSYHRVINPSNCAWYTCIHQKPCPPGQVCTF